MKEFPVFTETAKESFFVFKESGLLISSKFGITAFGTLSFGTSFKPS